MKNIIIILLVVLVVAFGLYALIPNSSDSEPDVYQNDNNIDVIQPQDDEILPVVEEMTNPTIIGKSVREKDITLYQYGEGEKEILFVGGIHGGYGWNTVLLAYEAIDYFEANPNAIPNGVKVTIIPVLNPDGLDKVVNTSDRFESSDISTSQSDIIAGRFNANEVDLNRNFDCEWQTTGKWQSRTVSGGDKVFSEPESLAIKNYIESKKPTAVVVWYSAAGGVYSSSCHNGILPETKDLTNAYATASGYGNYDEFDSYEVTGDMVNWLAKENIPAISVLLATHTEVEWKENKAGIKALLNYYSK